MVRACQVCDSSGITLVCGYVIAGEYAPAFLALQLAGDALMNLTGAYALWYIRFVRFSMVALAGASAIQLLGAAAPWFLPKKDLTLS